MKWTLIALLLVACSAERSGPGLTEEQFIATMVDLRRAAQEAGPDTARFEALRQEVLERHGVSDVELRAFVASRERDLQELAEVWDSVGARLTPPEAAR
ncbi:MAG TPA: hypothetical protein VFZ69_06915 [Longimicrobiales bacterium]